MSSVEESESTGVMLLSYSKVNCLQHKKQILIMHLDGIFDPKTAIELPFSTRSSPLPAFVKAIGVKLPFASICSSFTPVSVQ